MSEVQAQKETEIEAGPVDEKPDGFVIHDETTNDEKNEPKEPVTLEVKAEEEKTEDPIKIEVEDAGKPPARRLSRFDKRIKNLKEESATEVAEANARAEAAEAENKLLRLAQQQAVKKPDEDTFEGTEAEYKAALDAYNQQEIKRIASEEAKTLVNSALAETQKATASSQQDGVIDAHYDRAESMNVTNYSELEARAVDDLGEDFVKAIILSSDNSHRLLASIGAAPREAARIAQLAKSNPTKAFADALTFEIHPSLKPVSKTTLDPEKQVDPGRGVTKSEPGLEGVKFE